MFKQKRLACSFCGKRASEVSKLVAGPNVYICDACVAIANRIMSDSNTSDIQPEQPARSLWQRISAWVNKRAPLLTMYCVPAAAKWVPGQAARPCCRTSAISDAVRLCTVSRR